MAQTLWQSPSATAFDTIAAGQTKVYTVPATTIITPNQDFSFEFLFDNLSSAHSGTAAYVFRSLTSDATVGTNLDPVASVILDGSHSGRTAFIRDVYGMITRNIIVRITASAPLQFRLSVVGVTING